MKYTYRMDFTDFQLPLLFFKSDNFEENLVQIQIGYISKNLFIKYFSSKMAFEDIRKIWFSRVV